MWDVAATAAADVGCGILAIAGAAKLHEPAPFRDFASTAGLRVGATGARAVGVAELGLAAATVVLGGRAWFTALAVAYAGLAAVAALARLRRVPSCGCFGASSAPASWSHAVVDAAVAAGAGGAAVADASPLVDRVGGASGAGYVVFALIATVLAVALMTTAADLAAARRRPAPTSAA
jgi:hypothetical protein